MLIIFLTFFVLFFIVTETFKKLGLKKSAFSLLFLSALTVSYKLYGLESTLLLTIISPVLFIVFANACNELYLKLTLMFADLYQYFSLFTAPKPMAVKATSHVDVYAHKGEWISGKIPKVEYQPRIDPQLGEILELPKPWIDHA